MGLPTVLLVEDNELEAMVAERAIFRADVGCNVQVARDGVEACNYLFESNNPAPFLVLLDLKMPRVDGFEVLERIRASESTKRLPVVVFSTSDEEQDVHKSFDMHANSFVQKALDPETYETRLRLVLYYWMAVNYSAEHDWFVRTNGNVQTALHVAAGM